MHTIRILHGHDFLVVIQVVQQRREDPPRSIQLVVSHEVGVIALHGIQNQALVGLWDLQVGKAPSVGEVQLGDDGLHAQARELGVHLDIDGFVGLHANDQFVAGDVLEDARGHVFELDADFGLLLVER